MDDQLICRVADLEAQRELLQKEIEYLSKSNFDKVKQFHSVFNKEKDPTRPTVPTQEQINLRVGLVVEELGEVLTELGYDCEVSLTPIPSHSVDLSKLAKELADLLYVVYGTAAATGIDIDTVYDEVHNSNMSKLGEDGKPVYRDDGKVMKGKNYKPPNVKRALGLE